MSMRSSQRESVTEEAWVCPNCGAWEPPHSPTQCAAAIAGIESLGDVNMGVLFDEYSESRPLQLLMAGFEALELLNIGLIVTNSAGHLLLANRTAEQILKSRDGLELTPSGCLATSKGKNGPLGELGQQAGKIPLPGSAKNEAVLALQRPSGKRPLTLLVRSANRKASAPDNGGPATLVFILDPELPVEAAESELRQLYGLTAAETRLANLLLEGNTLEDCCDQLGIRRSTACSHLQHLFKKTGVQKQSQLVSLLFKTIGLVRAGNGDRVPRPTLVSTGWKDARTKEPALKRAPRFE
jgi:DNA-binding CsgD family transcriptional regulator